MFEELTSQFTLMDNDYMLKFFEGQNECVAVVLRALMDVPDLQVERVAVDRDLVSLQSHSSRLDVFAVDGMGRRYDVEVQRDLAKASPQRARFYSALMDSDALAKNTDYRAIPECVTIFVTEGDALGGEGPVCHVERIRIESGRAFEDGSHIIYANAAYTFPEGTGGAVADVLHDFMCADPSSMRCPVLAERARMIKQTEEGERQMSGVSEIIFNKGLEQGLEQGREQGLEQGLEQGRADAVATLMAAGLLSPGQIAEVFGITIADVERYAHARA